MGRRRRGYRHRDSYHSQSHGTCVASRYATGKGMAITSHKALCTNRYIRTAVMQAIRREQQQAGHSQDIWIKVSTGCKLATCCSAQCLTTSAPQAMALVPYKFSTGNMMLTERGYLHRERIRSEYRKPLNELGQSLYDTMQRHRAPAAKKGASKRSSFVGMLQRKIQTHRQRAGRRHSLAR